MKDMEARPVEEMYIDTSETPKPKRKITPGKAALMAALASVAYQPSLLHLGHGSSSDSGRPPGHSKLRAKRKQNRQNRKAARKHK